MQLARTKNNVQRYVHMKSLSTGCFTFTLNIQLRVVSMNAAVQTIHICTKTTLYTKHVMPKEIQHISIINAAQIANASVTL